MPRVQGDRVANQSWLDGCIEDNDSQLPETLIPSMSQTSSSSAESRNDDDETQLAGTDLEELTMYISEINKLIDNNEELSRALARLQAKIQGHPATRNHAKVNEETAELLGLTVEMHPAVENLMCENAGEGWRKLNRFEEMWSKLNLKWYQLEATVEDMQKEPSEPALKRSRTMSAVVEEIE